MLVINSKVVFTTLEELVNPEHTALLLIDLQNDYFEPGGYTDKMGWDSSAVSQIVPQIKRVLEAARHSGVLVVHVQLTLYPNFLADSPACLRMHLLRNGYKSGAPFQELPTRCIEGTRGWQIVDELTPLPDEVVVKKHRASAFKGTDLDMILRSNGIESVAIVGLVTNGCVMAAANDSRLCEYYPILLRDCIASTQPELHDAAFLIMSQDMDVVNSEEVLETWKRSIS